MSDNPYYEPTKFGLELIGEADLNEPDYSFDMVAVWRDGEGYYVGTDSGCSCPSPFESYAGKGDMTGPITLEQALEEASNLKGQNTYDLDAWNAFIAGVRAGTVIR